MRTHPYRRCWLWLAGLMACALPAAAQSTYPEKPVTMVVPFGPGGTSDIMARISAASREQTDGSMPAAAIWCWWSRVIRLIAELGTPQTSAASSASASRSRPPGSSRAR